MEKIKDVRLAMLVSASKALDYLESNPKLSPEDVMKYVIERVSVHKRVKVAGIAAANFVLNYKIKNYRASKKEVLHELTKSTEMIISSVDS